MDFYRNKRGMQDTVIKLILLVAGVILVIMLTLHLLSEGDKASAEATCALSIAMREEARLQKGIIDLKPVPFLCKTQKTELPEKKDADKKKIMKELADEIATTAKVFGRGSLEDVLKDVRFFGKTPCFVFKEVIIKKTDDFKEGDSISQEELINFMANAPYSIKQTADFCKIDGGFCESKAECSIKDDFKFDNDNSLCTKKDKEGCCYSKYTCLNNGGNCWSANRDENEYFYYGSWTCPRNLDCYVKKENKQNYLQFIQNDGKEVLVIPEKIEPSKIYAIAYGDKKKTDIAFTSAMGGTTVAGVGMALGGLTILCAGIAAAPIGIGVAAGGIVLGAFSLTQLNEEVSKYLQENKVSTIYVVPAEYMYENKLCTVQED